MVVVLYSFCLPQRHLGHCSAAPGSFRVKGSSHHWRFSSSSCFCNKISNVIFLQWQERQGSSHFKKVSFNCIKNTHVFSKQFLYRATGLWEQPHICKMQTTSELLELHPACCKGLRWWEQAPCSSVPLCRKITNSLPYIPLQCDSLLEGDQEILSELVLLMLCWCESAKDHLRHRLVFKYSYQHKLACINSIQVIFLLHLSSEFFQYGVILDLWIATFRGEVWDRHYIK